MIGVAEEFLRGSRIADQPESSGLEIATSRPTHVVSPIYDEQIRLLLQQLFFHPQRPQYRHVAFTAVDFQSDITPLCLNVARALSEEGKYHVGLIDARLESSTLWLESGKTEGRNAPEVGERFSIVQRHEWMNHGHSEAISDDNLTQLRRLSQQFDFSILCCGSISWLSSRVGRVCDGLVLVLTANQTRRLVVQKIRHQLQRAQVPVLGTILAERRFPVPGALYRKL